MTTSALLPPPSAFELPVKFTGWRPGQDAAVLEIVDAKERFVAQVQPTGSGKSLTYMAAALLSDARVCILTSTKGLQTQLSEDFHEMGLTDVRGMNSYQCVQVQEQFTTVDNGPCHSGFDCKLKKGGCLYYDAVAEAEKAKMVITNYDYWMTANRYGGGIVFHADRGPVNPFDLLVLDEAHAAPQELSDFLAIEFHREEIEGLLGGEWPSTDDHEMPRWSAWGTGLLLTARSLKGELEEEVTAQRREDIPVTSKQAHGLRLLRGMVTRLEMLVEARGDWVPELSGPDLRFDPLWPAEYGERYLFCRVPKVVLTSATIRPKTLGMLGITPQQSLFTEYPSSFPVSRRPIYQVNTIRLTFRSSEEEMRVWLSRIDQIIKARRDRKGIVHTGSYTRRSLVYRHSNFTDLMYTHDSKTTRATVERFKRAGLGSVLVSPSVVTGYDFPYQEVEYQIIGKIGFPDTRPKIIQARQASDKDYIHYLAMQQLVQACGRGMRAEDDQCECLVIDDNAKWFVPKYRHFAPEWFWQAWRWGNTIPAPLPKLQAGGG